MEWLQDFHFLRPYWLLALLVPIAWGWFLFKNERVQSSWAEVCDEHLLNYLLVKGENTQRRFSYVLAIFVAVVSIIAIAGPTWVKKKNPALSMDNPVMIMLNLSSDMLEKDVSPNRLVRAKYIIKDILQTFKATETGLMVYSDEPFVISPLTEDVMLIDNLLPSLEVNVMPANGDRLDKAIDMAVSRMHGSGYENGNLVVLTADVGERFDAALENARKAAAKGFDVNVIKVSAASNEKLQMIAEKGHGLYLNYNQSYAGLSNKINDVYNKKITESENMQTVWEDMGYYIFWLPTLLLLYYFRKGIILSLLLAMFCAEAHAGLFLNENQEAMRYFKLKQYDKAAQMFEKPQWRGAAAYKNGDYQKALKEFSLGADATSLYNQGNALAKMGKIDDAIKMYEEVLKQEPNFEDAKFNLEYLKNLKQNQQQQNQKQDQQQQDKQQQQSGNDNQKNEQNQDQQEKNQNQQQQQDNAQNEQQQNQEQNQEQNQGQNRENNSAEQNQQQDNQQQNNQQQDNQQQNQGQNQDEQQSSGSQNQENQQGQDQQQAQNQQSDGEKNNSSEKESQGGGQNNQGETSADNNESKGNQQSSGAQNAQDEQQNDGQEQDSETQAQFGEEDPQSEQKAKGVEIQDGDDEDAERKERIRAKMQKFRNIPEDKGGLIRAIIAKEYRVRGLMDQQSGNR